MRTSTSLTIVIDIGLPTAAFTDLVASHGQYIDLVKFGWGTALVTRDLDRKARILADAGIGCCFGGTLFEYHLWTGQLDETSTCAWSSTPAPPTSRCPTAPSRSTSTARPSTCVSCRATALCCPRSATRMPPAPRC